MSRSGGMIGAWRADGARVRRGRWGQRAGGVAVALLLSVAAAVEAGREVAAWRAVKGLGLVGWLREAMGVSVA